MPTRGAFSGRRQVARIVDPEGRETEILHRLVTLRGKHVIDIGCGDGRTTRRLARAAASVLGVDPDAEAIARARDAAPAHGDGSTFLAADAVTLDLPPGGFDIAVYSRSL